MEFILEKQNFRLTQSLWTKHVKDLKWRLVHHTQLRYRTTHDPEHITAGHGGEMLCVHGPWVLLGVAAWAGARCVWN